MAERTGDDDERQELQTLVRALHGQVEMMAEFPTSGRRLVAGKPAKTAAVAESGPVIQAAAGRSVAQESAAGATESLTDIRGDLGDCKRCPLHEQRKTIVFGEGNPAAKLVFVGEAPGADEDAQGRPFVGRAGQLLTKIIEAMKLSREDVYICNILKCRPPGNRNPQPNEIDACEPFLIRQLAAIRPQVICALGTFAAHTLLKSEAPITALRGRFHKYQGIDLMPTYHPAYLLRNPAAKKLVWEDVQKIMERFEETRKGD